MLCRPTHLAAKSPLSLYGMKVTCVTCPSLRNNFGSVHFVIKCSLVNTHAHFVCSVMASRGGVIASCVGYRAFHSSRLLRAHQHSYQFVVAGGGAGGLAVASTLTNKFGSGRVAVVEPSDVRHIYVHVHALL